MLFTSLDPVVATPSSREDARAAIAKLVRAGFGGGMLSLVDAASAMPANAAAQRVRSSWATSGALGGLLWTTSIALATLAVPVGTPAFGALVMLGAVALVVQATLAARLVAPECESQAIGPDADGAPCALKLLVRGSRSEVALARAVLATPAAPADGES